MRHSLIALAVAITASHLGSEAHAGLTFLGNATGFNEFILGDSTRTNTDSLGQVAVGGNATFNNFSIGSGVNSGNIVGTNDLVVGGNLGGSQVVNNGPGNILYNTVSNPSVFNNGGGKTNQGSSASFFAAASSTLLADSQNLAAQTANGTATVSSGTLNLTATLASGTTTNTVYFNLTAAQLTSASGLNIAITDNNGTTPVVIINVNGAAATFTNNYTSTFSGVTLNDLLFNFYNSTSGGFGTSTLSLNANPFHGSILAPMAAITANSSGQVNGEVIGASFTGNIETHNVDQSGSGQYALFNGIPTLAVTAVPEPATVISTFTGLAMVVGAAWRRRRRAA